jgi:hypothetical protein
MSALPLCLPKTSSAGFAVEKRIGSCSKPMATFFRLLLGYMWDCFRSHERLKAEILILRHQLSILHRKAPKRLRLSDGDRAFVWLYRPGSTETRHTVSHSDIHMAKVMRTPMKVPMSARPLIVGGF